MGVMTNCENFDQFIQGAPGGVSKTDLQKAIQDSRDLQEKANIINSK